MSVLPFSTEAAFGVGLNEVTGEQISAAFALCSGLAFGISCTARSKISFSFIVVALVEGASKSFFISFFAIRTSGARSKTIASSTFVITSSSRNAPFKSFFTIKIWSCFGNSSNASIKCSAVASWTEAACAGPTPKIDSAIIVGSAGGISGPVGIVRATCSLRRRRRLLSWWS